jgi:hypothetical protein
MDPLTVLLSALSLGRAAAQPLADQAVEGGYAELKALLIRKFGPESPKLEPTLDEYAADPEAYKAAVAKMLKEVGAHHDQEVVDRATELMSTANRAVHRDLSERLRRLTKEAAGLREELGLLRREVARLGLTPPEPATRRLTKELARLRKELARGEAGDWLGETPVGSPPGIFARLGKRRELARDEAYGGWPFGRVRERLKAWGRVPDTPAQGRRPGRSKIGENALKMAHRLLGEPLRPPSGGKGPQTSE